MKKKLAAAGLVLLAIAGIFGCGKKTGESSTVGTVSKDYVYRMTEPEGFDEGQTIASLVRAGDAVYGYGYEWNEEDNSTTLIFYQLGEDGSPENSYRISLEENISLNGIAMDANADIYCILNRYQVSEEGVDSEIEELEYIDEYFLTKMNLQGEEIFSVKLNEVPEIQKLEEEYGYFYVGNMVLSDGKGIYVSALEHYFKFDLEGNFSGIVNDETGDLAYASVFPLTDGRLAAYMYEESGMMVALVDFDTGTMGEKYKIPGMSYEYSCYPGIGYDLYLVDSNGVYGYNIGEEEKTQLLNYIDSDFEFYSIYSLVAVNEREFFGLYDSYDGKASPLALFSKVDPEDVKEKTQITLAMVQTNWQVRQEVVNFNKSNEEYRINIINYNSLYGSESDPAAAQNKLNTDIVSGNVPDLLLLEYSMPTDSYISKGLFEDLKPFIEQDAELSIEQFMPNIIEAFSVDDKLYTMVPSYYIDTLVAKVSDVGEKNSWTVQEAVGLLASKPEGTQFLGEITREDMLNRCMSMASSQFIDWETGKCSFDSEGFIQMLDFINSFPEEVDATAYTDDYWNNYDSMWREGKVLTQEMMLSDLRSYNYVEKGTFGEKITMIGFPSANGEGTVIMPSLQMVMSAKSANKEGAWQFLRTFLTEEYQEEYVTYALPISVKRMEALAEQAMQKPYYLDEDGNKVEYEDMYYINGVEIEIAPMTEQEARDLIGRISEITDVYRYDESLLNIIKEEAAPYFAGQKRAEDVAAIIQSRVQIYVNENR